MGDDTTTQSPAPSSAIAWDIPCIACGYNLRGLNSDGVCPECATSIGQSLSEQADGSTAMLIWSRCMVVGLFAWVLLSGLALTQSRFANRGEGSSRLIRTNYPGPKLWITDLRPASTEQSLTDPDAYSSISYALGCLTIAYLLTSPRTANPLEATLSLRRIARWFSVVMGAAVVGHQIGYFDWRWTDATEHSIPIIATVLLYFHLAVIAKNLGLHLEAKSLQFAACIAGLSMAAVVPLRFFEYDPGFRNWSRDHPMASMVFSAYGTVAVIGAVLAAGCMVRTGLAMIPMARRLRPN